MKKDKKVLQTEYSKRYIAIYTIKGVMFEIYSSAEASMLGALLV